MDKKEKKKADRKKASFLSTQQPPKQIDLQRDIGGHLVVDRDSKRIKLEQQNSISVNQSDQTRLNRPKNTGEGAYISDNTTSTQMGRQVPVELNQLTIPDGSVSGNTNDSRILDKATIQSFQNGTALNSAASNIAFEKKQAHTKMNQTVSGISQKHLSKSVKRLPSPKRNSYMKGPQLQHLQSPPLEQDEPSQTPQLTPKAPNKIQGPFSKRASSQQQSEDQGRDIDAWGTDGNINIGANYIMRQVENNNEQQIPSSNMSTQGAGEPFQQQPLYGPRRTSSVQDSRKISPDKNDYVQKNKNANMAQQQQQDLMKNHGIIGASQRKIKGKRNQKIKNSNREKQGSGSRRVDQNNLRTSVESNHHRTSLERMASGLPAAKLTKPKKQFQTGGQTYFFGGAFDTNNDNTKANKPKKQQQQTAQALQNSDYDTGSATTQHVVNQQNGRSIMTDKEIKIQKLNKQNVIGKNTATLKPQTADSHNSKASSNTFDDKSNEHAQNRFKRKEGQKASTGVIQQVSNLSSNYHIHTNSQQNNTIRDRMIQSRNSHSNAESFQQNQLNQQKGALNRQAGSRHSLHRFNKSSRNQLEPQSVNQQQFVDQNNSLSMQTLPAVPQHKLSMQGDPKNLMRPPIMLNKQSKDFSGTVQTFLSAIESSQGVEEGEDTAESYMDNSNFNKSINMNQRNQQNSRYRSQGEGNQKFAKGNLLNVQNQILANGNYNEAQLKKKLAKGGQKLSILNSQDRLNDQNGNPAQQQPGLFIYRTNDNTDSRRKYQSGYIPTIHDRNLNNSKNQTIDWQPSQNQRKEDPYRDLSGGRTSAQLQELKSNSILQNKQNNLHKQQLNPLSNSMEAPLNRGQQWPDDGQRHYFPSDNLTTLQPPDSRNRQFRAQSQQDKYMQMEERQKYPPIMTQSQSYQTLNNPKDGPFAIARQSMPNPILKPSKLPSIQRASGNDSALRASYVMEDNYQNKTELAANDAMRQGVKIRKNQQQMMMPKTLAKHAGNSKRAPMDSDFMLYYKQIKMGGQGAAMDENHQLTPEDKYDQDGDIYNNNYLEETPEGDLKQQITDIVNAEIAEPMYASDLHRPASLIEEQTEHNETSKFEISKNSQNSQKSTEKMKPGTSEKNQQVEAEQQERQTERRGSAGTSKKSNTNTGQTQDNSLKQQLRFSMAANKPNNTTYPVTNLAQHEANNNNSLNNTTNVQQNNVKSDPKKDDGSQLLNFEDYKMVTGTEMMQQQPSLLDTPPMSFSIQQQMLLNSNRTKTVLATTQPLAVFEIQPREEKDTLVAYQENNVQIEQYYQQVQNDQKTETTLEKQADKTMRHEENPYLNIDDDDLKQAENNREQPNNLEEDSDKQSSDKQSQSDLPANDQLEVKLPEKEKQGGHKRKKSESPQYQKVSVTRAPNKKLHLFASKTSAEMMTKDKIKREQLKNLKDIGTDKLDEAVKSRYPEKTPDKLAKQKNNKAEKLKIKKLLKANQTQNQMAFRAKHMVKEDLISEQHKDTITVYDESQLGDTKQQQQEDADQNTQPETSNPGQIQIESPRNEDLKDSNAEVQVQDSSQKKELKSFTKGDDQDDTDEKEYSSDDQQEEQKPRRAGYNQVTMRSHHTNSTAYIVEQMDKIKVEWAILDRAQQNITSEKDQITKHMKDLQRLQDKADQKRQLEEEKQKLEDHRLQIGHEMMLLEQLKAQMEQMKAGLKPNAINQKDKDAPQGNFGLEKASKSLPQIPRSNQANMKKGEMSQQMSQTNVAPEGSPQQFIYSFGQDQEPAQVMVIHPDEQGSPSAQQQLEQSMEQSMMSKSDVRHVQHHHSTQDFMMKNKAPQKKKSALIMEPVNDYSDIGGLQGKVSKKSLPTGAKDLRISSSSVDLIDNDDQYHDETPPVEKEEPEDELTFNKLDVGLDSQMGRIGRKTVGGNLGKAMANLKIDDADGSGTQYDGPEEGEEEQEDGGDDDNILQMEQLDQSQISHLSLNINYLAGMKVPGGVGQMFDWAESALMQDVIVNKYKFSVIDEQTGQASERFFDETQILQILKKIIQDPAELSKKIDIKQTFKISLQTLAELMGILGQQSGFPAILEKFPDITVENLIKLLVKCRQLILTRRLAFQTLKSLQKFQKTVARIRFEIDLYLQESEDGRSENRHQSELYIRLKHRSQEVLPQEAQAILNNVEILRTKHKLFENMQGVTHKGNYVKNVMCYKKVDAEKLVHKEYESMMQITKAVGIQIGPITKD